MTERGPIPKHRKQKVVERRLSLPCGVALYCQTAPRRLRLEILWGQHRTGRERLFVRTER